LSDLPPVSESEVAQRYQPRTPQEEVICRKCALRRPDGSENGECGCKTPRDCVVTNELAARHPELDNAITDILLGE
jgi:hypothetical protein